MPPEILIIDDDPDLLALLKIRLSSEGYKVIAAANGHDGILLAEKSRPDLILLDMMIPGMDGREICLQIRALPALENTPVLFLTARENLESKLAGFSSGAQDYIIKPFEMVELLARIESQLKIQFLHKTVAAHLEQVKGDLELARQVQDSILPQVLPCPPGLNFATEYLACESVGGDYYDFFQSESDSLSFFVVDVSGHGIAASFLTALAKMAFKHALGSGDPLHLILEAVNQEFLTILKTDHYLTCFLCRIHLPTRTLEYAKAGHLNQILYRESEDRIIELETSGLFLGCFAQGNYETRSLKLQEGDKILLFTDGLVECKNSRGEEFGRSRLEKCLRRARGKDALAFHHEMADAQKDHLQNSPRDDDFCFILADINQNSLVEKIKETLGYPQGDPLQIAHFKHKEGFEEILASLLRRIPELSLSQPIKDALKNYFQEIILIFGQAQNPGQFRWVWQYQGAALGLYLMSTTGKDLQILENAQKAALQIQLKNIPRAALWFLSAPTAHLWGVSWILEKP